MRWPWQRRHVDDAAAAKDARDSASEQLRQAHGLSDEVDRTAEAAAHTAARTDRFVREVERSLRRLKQGPAR